MLISTGWMLFARANLLLRFCECVAYCPSPFKVRFATLHNIFNIVLQHSMYFVEVRNLGKEN